MTLGAGIDACVAPGLNSCGEGTENDEDTVLRTPSRASQFSVPSPMRLLVAPPTVPVLSASA